MNQIEVAWLAGLLEGEGCFCIKSSGGAYINVSMTDEDVVRRVHSLTGVGTVITHQRPNRKRVWTWRTGDREAVDQLAKTLLPHMGERRSAKIRDLIAHLQSKRRIRVKKGELVHGMRSTYGKGCRCAPCHAAEIQYTADYRERKKNGQIGTKGVARGTWEERQIREAD